MKTQMQIVQEAITKLERMGEDEFRKSLVKSGAVEVSEILNINAETLTLIGTFEEKAAKLMQMFEDAENDMKTEEDFKCHLNK